MSNHGPNFFCNHFLRDGHTFKQKYNSSLKNKIAFINSLPIQELKRAITSRIQSYSICLNSTLSPLFPIHHSLLITVRSSTSLSQKNTKINLSYRFFIHFFDATFTEHLLYIYAVFFYYIYIYSAFKTERVYILNIYTFTIYIYILHLILRG